MLPIIITIIITVAADWATKIFATIYFPIAENTNLAFGISIGQLGPTLLSGTILAILIYLVQKNHRQYKHSERIYWGMIIGGGIANFAERLFFNHVTDFIDFGWFPSFNLADIAITIGAVLLILKNLKSNSTKF
ncbi:MAG: signal peptidase II [Patescibacteria group bacterium]|nr:signal peptidase II [Patescibacteria group bacterium]